MSAQPAPHNEVLEALLHPGDPEGLVQGSECWDSIVPLEASPGTLPDRALCGTLLGSCSGLPRMGGATEEMGQSLTYALGTLPYCSPLPPDSPGVPWWPPAPDWCSQIPQSTLERFNRQGKRAPSRRCIRRAGGPRELAPGDRRLRGPASLQRHWLLGGRFYIHRPAGREAEASMHNPGPWSPVPSWGWCGVKDGREERPGLWDKHQPTLVPGCHGEVTEQTPVSQSSLFVKAVRPRSGTVTWWGCSPSLPAEDSVTVREPRHGKHLAQPA